VLVAETDDATIQNVLMDAFDQGIVNSRNFARARTIITSRLDGRKRKKAKPDDYTVVALKEDIASATIAKDSFAREAQSKESRLYTLLDGLAILRKDMELMELLVDESLDKMPDLAGTYNGGPRAAIQKGSTK